MLLESRDPRLAGELAALVGVEGSGSGTVLADVPVQHLQAEGGDQGVGHLPGEHLARIPVHDPEDPVEASFEAHVGDVHAPCLIGAVDIEIFYQLGLGFVPLCWLREVRFRALGLKAHLEHEPSNPLSPDAVSPIAQGLAHLPRAVESTVAIDLVDQAHPIEV